MAQANKRVAVVGLWHLGCTVAASLASKNFRVAGIDFEKKSIDKLNRGILPLFEPGLTELTSQQIARGFLSFSTDFKKIRACDYVIIAHDTPVDRHDRVDLSIVLKAFARIKKFMRRNSLLIVMSQVPAGTCRKIYISLQKNRKQVEVVYNPENVRLGNAISTFLEADRQIIGLSSKQAQSQIKKFYSFYKNPLLFMSLESAELVKHGINSFLATSISFINQLADISERAWADIKDVIRGLKSDSRIGQKAFLSPGLGFAGGTLGRDLKALEDLAKQKKIQLPLITQVYQINQNRKLQLYERINKIYPKLKGKTIALFGLTYKPGTDTLRRSLALEIAKDLTKQGAKLVAFDPALKKLKNTSGLALAKSALLAAKGADLLLIITEWPEFVKLDYKKIKKVMRHPVVFDTKNILEKALMQKLGYQYYGTGV